jgi:hypothetical protein
MYVKTLGFTGHGKAGASAQQYERELTALDLEDATWIIAYAVCDAPLERLCTELKRRFPKVQVCGATSFQGVFTPQGFGRGVALLVGAPQDDIRVEVAQYQTASAQAAEAARSACSELEARLGKRPQGLLLHATPGFEERILEGIKDVFGTEVPVYGGSAADDSISGQWSVFTSEGVIREGFVLAGVVTQRNVLGSFLGGYLPAGPEGRATRVSGRIVHEIDGRPAASVYNEWTRGAIASELRRGGNILLKTNLSPIARIVDERFGMPRRLLSHPHEVTADGQGLAFFAEFTQGEQMALMTSTPDPLVTRVRRTAERARGNRAAPLRGGILVYCAGCLGIVLEQASKICQEFTAGAGNIPFIGVSTFGEQGCFFERSESRHGNLMCSAVLFD